MKDIRSGMRDQAFALTPLGGGRQIGGNAWHIEWDGISFLIDCGLHPERPGWFGLPQLERIKGLDFVILTHAHNDHSGALPYLLKRHPVPLYTTRATAKLLRPMYRDSLKLQRRLFGIDRFNQTRLPELGQPLFDQGDVDRTFELIRDLDPGFSHEGLKVTPFHAGHILGGVGLVLEKNGKRVCLTSDLSDIPKETSLGLYLPAGPFDLVISEGTRGIELNLEDELEQRRDEEERVFALMARILAQNGSILFPSFVIERAQSVARLVARAKQTGRIPATIPLYMAGMADGMTALHAQELKIKFDWEPIPSRDWFDDLLSQKQAILIAGSGMLNSGSGAARLAEQILEDAGGKHGIIFSGFLAPGSPGSYLVKRRPSSFDGLTRAWVNGRALVVKTEEIHQIHLSCHASGSSLVNLIKRLDPSSVVLVHGDEEALESLAGGLRAEGLEDVRIPANGESVGFKLQRPDSLVDLGRPTPEDLIRIRPWNLTALKAISQRGDLLDDGTDPGERLVTLLNLLTRRALRDGNLVRARDLLEKHGASLGKKRVEGFWDELEEIARLCPQNSDQA